MCYVIGCTTAKFYKKHVFFRNKIYVNLKKVVAIQTFARKKKTGLKEKEKKSVCVRIYHYTLKERCQPYLCM